MKMNLYKGLTRHLNILSERYQIQITIKDYCGLLTCDENLFSALEDFYIHKKSYCMAIKSNEKLWGYCLDNKELIYKRLTNKPESYMGICYAGIMEFVVPIIHKDSIIGSIHIGEFFLSKDEKDKFLQRISKRHHIGLDQLENAYDDSTRSVSLQLSMLEAELQIAIEYIRLIYEQLEVVIEKKPTKYFEFNRPYILSHAIEYMKQNYKRQLQLEEVASFCHCSKSYLSHQFKKNMGMTLKSYLNSLRIQAAKNLLEATNPNIIDLAFDLGFKDSNYFSKVFKDFVGLSPLQYKKEHQS